MAWHDSRRPGDTKRENGPFEKKEGLNRTLFGHSKGSIHAKEKREE
jgi:hypothetical protein